jgi:hypothetical protein
VHNLRAIDWRNRDGAFDWARRFDERARALLTSQPGDAASLASAADYRLAVPTPDHFIPMLYIAGLAAAAGQPLSVPIDGCTYGSISMTMYTLGAELPIAHAAPAGAAPLPDAPPESANIRSRQVRGTGCESGGGCPGRAPGHGAQRRSGVTIAWRWPDRRSSHASHLPRSHVRA